jgi:general stress protein 26
MAQDPIQKLNALADSFEDGILVTHGTEGVLHGRPMQIAGREGASILWLVTAQSTPKVEEMKEDARVVFTMQSRDRFVTLAGTARLVRDEVKAAELWTPAWRVWFQSPQDPELVLVQIRLDQGAYWDRRGLRGVKAALQMARGLVSKSAPRPEDDTTQHARVDLSR